MVGNYDALCAGHNSRCGRDSTAIFLALDPFSNMVWCGSTNTCQPNMRKSSPRSLPSLSIRIDLDTQGRIGPGKIQLLENIRSCGSISAAGRAMNMSYKRAWGLVDEINRICKRAAVERWEGGNDGGGAMLTPFGVSLVARYRKIERLVAGAAHEELLALLAENRCCPKSLSAAGTSKIEQRHEVRRASPLRPIPMPLPTQ